METKGFFASLFDLSFSSLVTTKVIKLVYVVTLIAIGLAELVFIVAAFQTDSTFGVMALVLLAPVSALFYAVYARVLLEFVIAVFRIMETNVELVNLQRSASASPPAEAATAPTAL